MKDFGKLKGVLDTRKRTASKYVFKIERHVLLFYTGTDEERRQTHSQVMNLIYQKLDPPGIIIRPAHEEGRPYDRLELRVVENKEEHIDCYLKSVDVIPEICNELSIPFLDRRREQLSA